MTKIPSSSKVLTIIGLVIEGLSFLAMLGITLLFSRIPAWFEETILLFSEDVLEFNQIMNGIPFIRVLLILFSVFISILFIINLIFFIPTILGKKSQTFTSNVFLYQAILGGISLFTNQLLGAIYLISGIIGRNELEKNIENVRDGI